MKGRVGRVYGVLIAFLVLGALVACGASQAHVDTQTNQDVVGVQTAAETSEMEIVEKEISPPVVEILRQYSLSGATITVFYDVEGNATCWLTSRYVSNAVSFRGVAEGVGLGIDCLSGRR